MLMFTVAMVFGLALVQAAHRLEAQAPAVATADALKTQLADAQRQLSDTTVQVFDRDVELVHVRTELANCHASNDSLELSRQVTDLVRRCETLFAVKCKWDDAQRRVVKDVSPSQEPQP